MAATKIADILIPDVWVPYVIHRTIEKSALVQSGIVVPNASFDILAQRGGTLIQMPYWNDLAGADEVLSDSVPLTPGKITSGKDIAVLLMRGKAWGAHDLTKALSGSDPMSAIGDLVANYWVKREQAILIAFLKGMFTGTLSTTHVKDVAIEAGDSATEANLISGNAVIDAATLLGDEADALTALVMHSVPYSRLQKLNLIEYVGIDATGKRVEAGSSGSITVPTFLGKRIIVDDGVPVVAGSTNGKKYTTYLFAPGAVARGEGLAPVPVETDRDSLLGEDYLIHRRHFILHVRGVKYTSNTQVGVSPTNAELEIAANWSRVYDVKDVKCCTLITNG